MIKQKIIVVTGPTATGKTALGVLIAEKLNGEVVSADSMQIYKYMDIGTAKPTADEMRGIVHHMIDIILPWEEYSVARYVKDASQCIDDILSRGKQPILVGGSGLYIDSLIAGREFLVRSKSGHRQSLEDEYEKVGAEAMLRKLREVDPDSAAKLHANDKKRIVRALEAFLVTGKPLSLHDMESKAHTPRYEAIKFALSYADRSSLYARINHRVDEMLRGGLENEVRSLLDMKISRSCTAMQAIGYKEIVDAISNESDIDDTVKIPTAVDRIKMESRRYAKRQLTWLRRDKDVNWIIRDGIPDTEHGAEMVMRKLYEAK